jgi:hypothetical protein
VKRLLWLGLGLGAGLAVGVLVVRKLTQTAQSYTPAGIAGSLKESAGGAVEELRSFIADVRYGMAEREQQIHEAFAEGVAFEDQFDELRGDPRIGDDEIFPEEGSR